MRRYERREELRDGNRTVPNTVGFRSHHHDHVVLVCGRPPDWLRGANGS